MPTRLFAPFVVLAVVALTPATTRAEDVFSVNSVTPIGDDRYDVKLRNDRTGYIHSVTVYVDVNIGLKFKKGDRVTVVVENGRQRIEPYTPPAREETGGTTRPLQGRVEKNETPTRYPARDGGKPVLYILHDLGARDDKGRPTVRAEAVFENGNRKDISPDVGRRSLGVDRPYQPLEKAFDDITGQHGNWVGSSVGGGRNDLRPGAIGDVNVRYIDDFDHAAKRHDVGTWLEANFEPGAKVRLYVDGLPVELTVKPFHEVQFDAAFAFQGAARATLERAREALEKEGDKGGAAAAARFLEGLASVPLPFTPAPADILKGVLREPAFAPYRRDEAAETRADMRHRLANNPALAAAMAKGLECSPADVLKRMDDPAVPNVFKGKAWEEYVADREGAFNLNSIQKNFPLADLISRDDRPSNGGLKNGRFVSVAFGGEKYLTEKAERLVDLNWPVKCMDALRKHADSIRKEAGHTIPRDEANLLRRAELCVPTEADAERVRKAISRITAEGSVPEVRAMLLGAWGDEAGVREGLRRMVRAPKQLW